MNGDDHVGDDDDDGDGGGDNDGNVDVDDDEPPPRSQGLFCTEPACSAHVRRQVGGMVSDYMHYAPGLVDCS